ncbi:MAG: hypothetical protein OEX00_06715 [Gammaproteobacteria bacterium]|nr:hypothetical protein [Gammaproteobacteria bacterium]
MQAKTKKRSILAIALITSLSICAAMATLLVYQNISTTMRIKMTVMLDVFDVDGVTRLTAIDLGDFTHGQTKYFPGGLSEPPTQFYIVANNDEMSWYLGGLATEVPTDVLVWIMIRRGDKTEAYQWEGSPINSQWIYGLIIESEYTNPDPNTQFANMYVRVDVAPAAPFGTYAPTINIGAYSTVTG